MSHLPNRVWAVSRGCGGCVITAGGSYIDGTDGEWRQAQEPAKGARETPKSARYRAWEALRRLPAIFGSDRLPPGAQAVFVIQYVNNRLIM